MVDFWSSWGVFRGGFRGSGGPPGGLLGASWGLLEAILRGLGLSLFIFYNGSISDRFWDDFGPEKGGPRDPFGTPNWSKIGPKTIPNLIRFLRPSKSVSKTVLGPSWADLGRFGASSWGPGRRFGVGIPSIS